MDSRRIINFDLDELTARLTDVADGQVQTGKSLASYTSYKIGGPTALWVAPSTVESVGRVLEFIGKSKAPLFVLGRGSNLLVSDAGWNGVTLYLGENLSGWTFDRSHVEVLAGTLLMDLIRAAVGKGLGGMELLAGIPGGVGGALRMNAGAFGQEIQQITTSVAGFRQDGAPYYAHRREIDFSYRRASKLEKVVITSGRFRFEKEDPEILKARMGDILALRAKKQPLRFPSCGSVFKRPAGYYAGALIEEAGLKGERIGDAMVSEKHAGFILNTANAKAADVYALIRRIEDRVWDRFGVKLEREVKLVGNFENPTA
jgi:UDP-N-acetylmuramate dehydrogenase